jgi:methyltransferase (TIGR00027 family)
MIIVIDDICMPSDQPSTTALFTAAARAAHPIVDDRPHIFVDSVASEILGDQAQPLLSFQRDNPSAPVLLHARADVVCRARWVEDRLAGAVRSGVDQYVLLAAGLDSFAYRSELARQVRTFELDRPATQEWKARQLEKTTLTPLGELVTVPVDLGCEDLVRTLLAAGLDLSRRAVVAWLGCTVYLTREAILATLTALASLPAGSELLFDCLAPVDADEDPSKDGHLRDLSSAVTRFGEPWRSRLDTGDVDALLAASGWRVAGYRTMWDAVPRELWERTDGLAPNPAAWLARAVIPRAR